MLRLMTDVFPHRTDVHRTDAELAITRLPCKVGVTFVLILDPAGRGTLQLLDNLGGRMIFGLHEEDVDVVADGIDFDEGESWFLRMPVM